MSDFLSVTAVVETRDAAERLVRSSVKFALAAGGA